MRSFSNEARIGELRDVLGELRTRVETDSQERRSHEQQTATKYVHSYIYIYL